MIKGLLKNKKTKHGYSSGAVAGVMAIVILACGCGNSEGNKPAPSSTQETQTQSMSSEITTESSTGESESAQEQPTASVQPPKSGLGNPADATGDVFYSVDPSFGFYDAGAYKVADPDNKRKLDETLLGFGFGISANGVTSQAAINNQKRFDNMGIQALATDLKSSEKTLYLTFDCGYEYQSNTLKLLDVLKEKKVKAAFFCTTPFIKSEPATVQRMIDEGHIIGSHSDTHPNFPDISRKQMAQELYSVYTALDKNFNYQTKYFRFPAGRNSDSSLDLVASQGYRSIFWSVAYSDFDQNNQIGVDAAFKIVSERTHPGAVILLHGISLDNSAMLGKYIDWARENGYVFKTLDEYYAMP